MPAICLLSRFIRKGQEANSCPSSPEPLQSALPRDSDRPSRRTTTPRTYITAEVLNNWLVISPYIPRTNRKSLQHLSSIAVIITDQEYPVRPVFSLLTKVLEDFTSKVPQSSFANPSAISFPEINTYIQKYQDPAQADPIMRVQQELDETKIILVHNLSIIGPKRTDSDTCNNLFLCHSTRRLSPSCSAERNSMILWNDQLRSPPKPRCSTRRLKRYFPISNSSSIIIYFIDPAKQLLRYNVMGHKP
jgi:hypothetical protein